MQPNTQQNNQQKLKIDSQFNEIAGGQLNFNIKPNTNPISKLRKFLSSNPSRLIISSFLLTILVGACLLSLPIAAASGRHSFLTALFTATSATCVTGLVVVDTATGWSLFGQVVILILIQIGGLSLLTILSAFGLGMQRRMNLNFTRALRNTTAGVDFGSTFSLVRKVVTITFVIETMGAIFFIWRFSKYMPFAGAVKRGLFHAVSAFCNAGFDLMGDFSGPGTSISAFHADHWVVIGTAVMIISGGLGFVVWNEILHFKRSGSLRFHTRLVLTVTTILIVFGTLFFYLAEVNRDAVTGSLAELPLSERWTAAFFQSVTLRTAGFNTLDQTLLSPASKAIGIVLMIIGAGPASTGGGIKITTAAVLVAAVKSDISGKNGEVHLLKHRLSNDIIRRSVSILMMALIITWSMSILISITLASTLEQSQVPMIDMLYEAVSAFGTVGVSALGTNRLGTLARLGLIVTMYIGRVGPASMALSFLSQKITRAQHIYPEGRTFVG